MVLFTERILKRLLQFYILMLTLPQVVPILTKLIHSMSAIRLYIPNDLRSSEHRLSVLKSLQVIPDTPGHDSTAGVFFWFTVGED